MKIAEQSCSYCKYTHFLKCTNAALWCRCPLQKGGKRERVNLSFPNARSDLFCSCIHMPVSETEWNLKTHLLHSRICLITGFVMSFVRSFFRGSFASIISLVKL